VHPSSVSPLPTLSDILSDLLAQAGVDTSSRVHVTGPAALAALLWFCRHGYEQVGVVGAGRCPTNDCDLLLAPQTCDLAALAGLLDHGPHPRPGGVLIVQTPICAPLAPNRRGPVQALLERSGYRIERSVRGHHRELHVARRLDPAAKVTTEGGRAA
jgi:hypothetical protein